jgi:hypothetical protein
MRTLILAATTIAVLAIPAISMASAYVPHYRVTSLTATTTHDGTSYAHDDTLTRGENHRFTGIASAGSVTPGESVSGGTLHHSEIDISGGYPNGCTWAYDGPLAGGIGIDSRDLEWNGALMTTNHLINPITVTPYHANDNDAEWGPDSCSGLRSESNG